MVDLMTGEEQIEAVLAIWQNAAAMAHPFLPPDYWRDNRVRMREIYLPRAQTLICHRDTIVMGFISIVDSGHIGALFVAPAHQKSGVGGELMRFAKSCYPHLTLTVYTKNHNAVGFYRHCGFAIVQEQPNEDTGFPEYFMEWRQRNVGRYCGDGSPPPRFTAKG